MAQFPFSFLLLLFQFLVALNPCVCFDHEDEFSILDFDYHGDYAPPSPPPSPLPPLPPSLSCEEDLKGTGSLNTLCVLNSSLEFGGNVNISGNGSLHILPGVILRCPLPGCFICVNVSKGVFSFGENARIISGSLFVSAVNAYFLRGSLVNVSALAGEPPAQTTGTPSEWQGGGGGHGGRGASCLTDNTKSPDDVWGGDAYSWSTLEKPWSYGSKGGSTSKEEDYGGEGGGRIRVEVQGVAEVDGSFLANGGDGGMKGGGGSGGSVYINANRMTGSGEISATGGNGFAGGGGGRISINVFSRHDNTLFFGHGGSSFGCPENAGGAGTYYDSVPRSLTVTNQNMSTNTDTLLMEFPKRSPWTNIYLKDHAKAAVPLYWSRVQVQGQISLSCGALLSFGLAQYATSEFELMAEELLMSESVIKIYGALRMTVKIHLMWNSKMLIEAGSDAIVETSLLEASNLVVLKESSVIHSNSYLGVHGQGYLNLSGPGNVIEAQRLTLSLFFSISVGSGSILRGPLKNASSEDNKTDRSFERFCELRNCPVELLHPPEDCNVNSSLAFTLQICRVEYVIVSGSIKGSVIHFHWVRGVFVHSSGTILTSGLGCTGGVGRGKTYDNGLGGGGGHGGKGGDGYYNGTLIEGGAAYGDADLPCEFGSGSGNGSLAGATAGGGIIVMGSMEHSLSSLSIYGSLQADGESFEEDIEHSQDATRIGPGGGSGGTILLFITKLTLGNFSIISSAGGHGSLFGGGGGGGGRVHFHWSDIPTGDEYLPIASVAGSIHTGGGFGRGQGHDGKSGTVTGKPCPRGLYGIYCQECPVGTFKNVSGSDRALCYNCPSKELPHRGVYLYIRGGVTENPCPYQCISDRYRMPKCYTALEELIDTFGGPWLFSFILVAVLFVLAIVLSVARLKYVGADELPARAPAHRGSRIDHSFPFLESLNEVLEMNRIEETQSHVHRMYFMGPNTFTEPWHLVHSPPEQVMEIVYEDAFNRFVDEINILATYQWWEGSIHSILSIVAYPLAWSWLQWRRQQKLQKLREFVRSEYDHSCLRSCRSRALYEGLKVAATADLMLAYMDFFCGGDEKRNDLPARLHQRLPICLIFGGDGNYLTPFSLESDTILTSLMSQSVPSTIWYRFVAGLNAQLRLVSRAHFKVTLSHVIGWLETHANPALSSHGVCVDLAWSQPTSSGYCQFGLLVRYVANETGQQSIEDDCRHLQLPSDELERGLEIYSNEGEHMMIHKRVCGGILHLNNLQTLRAKSALSHPLSFIVRNTKPVGHQDLVGLLISLLLLADFSLVLLILLQLYSISLLDFFLVLFILPLAILLPFPAGINALFGHGHKRSAALSRLYALWNITSLTNIVTALVCGFLHHRRHSNHPNFQTWNFSMDESEWWMLPSGLLLCKVIQTRLVDCHVANEEIQDHTLYTNDPDLFWQT